MLSVGIFITIVIIALLIKTGWRPGFNIPWIMGIAGVVVVIFLARGCISSDGKNENNRSRTTTYHAPPPAPIVKIGKERTLFKFGHDGCVSVFLRGDWGSYPKGGAIVFRDVDGRIVFRDKPGVQNSSSLPSGNYNICKDDSNAWGVEIWQ